MECRRKLLIKKEGGKRLNEAFLSILSERLTQF